MGRALRCERAAGERALSDLVLAAVRDDAVRRAAERTASETPSAPARGEVSIEATWPGGDDVDIALLAADGSRLSWMGGRTTVVASDGRAAGTETVGLRYASSGSYIVEVTRTAASDQRAIRGQLRIRALGETRTVPFVLTDARAAVSRVTVGREAPSF